MKRAFITSIIGQGGAYLAEFPLSFIEARKQRKLMLKKIKQNVIDIFRLKACKKA